MRGEIKIEHIFDNEYLFNTMTSVLAINAHLP